MFIGTAQENARASSPGFSGCRLATNTSFAMIETVPSILAPRMVMPVESSSTTARDQLFRLFAPPYRDRPAD